MTAADHDGAHDDALLESLVDDYIAKAERGEAPSPTEHCAARPDLLPALRSMLALAGSLPGGEPCHGQADPLIGRRLSQRYTLRTRLGAGGMGLVYSARDEQLARDVAVKVLDDLFAGDPQRVERFRREAESLAALDDPHIVAVHDLDLEASPPYLVMDRIVGFDLAALLRALAAAVPADRLPSADEVETVAAGLLGTPRAALGELFGKPWPQLVALLGVQMCQALTAAHGVGVVHRDVKPSNFMLDAAGRLRLLDFGLARRDLDPTLTRAEARVGTPRYMAPEQLRLGEASVASDVYSLGATLYESLCLGPAFDRSGSELEHQILYEDPMPPWLRRARAPADLAHVCLMAMAKVPAKRFASAADLEADLQRFLRWEPVLARPRVWPAPLRAAVATYRHHRAVIAALTAVAVLAVALALGSGRFLGGELAARELARRAEVADLRAGLPPTLGFNGGRSDRLQHPRRADHIALLDRILARDPNEVLARFLRLWVRAEEEPEPAVAGADRASLAAALGQPRFDRLWEAASALQQRDRTDREAGFAQLAAAAVVLARLQPEDDVVRRLRIVTSLLLAEYRREGGTELERVLDAVAAEENALGPSAFTHWVRGTVAQFKGSPIAARDAYLAADRLCPDDSGTLHSLARVHRQLSDLHQARQYMERALALSDAPHVNHLEQYALVLMALDDYTAAEAALARFPVDEPLARVRHGHARTWLRLRQAAAAADAVAREPLLRAAEASLAEWRECALSDREEAVAADFEAYIAALRQPGVAAAGVYLDMLLGRRGTGPVDPLQRQLLASLAQVLAESPDLLTRTMGELLSNQARVLQRLEVDGIEVR
jgi:hypothetical protein